MVFFDEVLYRQAATLPRRHLGLTWAEVLPCSFAAVLLLVVLSLQPHLLGFWFWQVLCAAGPAFAANMTPPGVAKLIKKLYGEQNMPRFATKPIWKSRLGEGKTWLGLIVGTLMGAVIAWLQYQQLDSWFYRPFFLADGMSSRIVLLLGAWVGFMALFGDAVESYFKRWLGFERGELWYPLDYWDFIFGAVVAMVPIWFLGFTTLPGLESPAALLWLLVFCMVVLPCTAKLFKDYGGF